MKGKIREPRAKLSRILRKEIEELKTENPDNLSAIKGGVSSASGHSKAFYEAAAAALNQQAEHYENAVQALEQGPVMPGASRREMAYLEAEWSGDATNAYINAARDLDLAGDINGEALAYSNAAGAATQFQAQQAAGLYESSGEAYASINEHQRSAAAYENAAGLNLQSGIQLNAAGDYANAGTQYQDLNNTANASTAFNTAAGIYANEAAGSLSAGHLNSAKEEYLDAYHCYNGAGNAEALPAVEKSLANIYEELASTNSNQSDALHDYLEAAKFFAKISDSSDAQNAEKQAATLYNSLAKSAANAGDYTNASSDYENAAEIFQKLGDLVDAGHNYYRAGVNYGYAGQTQESNTAYNNAGQIYENLANSTNDTNEQLKYYHDAIVNYQHSGNSSELVSAYSAVASDYNSLAAAEETLANNNESNSDWKIAAEDRMAEAGAYMDAGKYSSDDSNKAEYYNEAANTYGTEGGNGTAQTDYLNANDQNGAGKAQAMGIKAENEAEKYQG
ncbi:MAG: hypothetical protein K2X27_24840 [Candidatus Obscuribacterales bacterium]|nr:hypothetical protein [Candidatus Obscuribacterales bacterium]